MASQEFMCLYLLLISTCFHFVWGECVLNSTMNCNMNAKLVVTNNCSECVCLGGFFLHDGLSGCEPCTLCKSPNVIIQNCTPTSDTECGRCQKTYFHTEAGCKKCRKCKHGLIKACGRKNDTICATIPTTTFTHEDHAINVPDNGKVVDCKKNDIWFTLFVMESTIVIAILIVICVIYKRCSRNRYTVIDTASTSLSSLMLTTKSKSQSDINVLTMEERKTMIRELPGGYADALGMLLNPCNVPQNWVQLAYQFNYTLNKVANLKEKKTDFTQDVLLELGVKNSTTVERLFNALKQIKRDDACGILVEFVLSLRKDNESAIVYLG